MRRFRLTANRHQVFCTLLTVFAWLHFALLPVPADAQSSASSSTGSLQVSVRDRQGHPLTGAVIHLQLQNKSHVLNGRTGALGRYRFAALPPGTYLLRAEMPGYGSASLGPFIVQAGTGKSLKITLPPARNSSASLQFFDEPQFTIAGVTDPTSLGGHGSNAAAPAKDELTREVVTLGSPSSAPLPAKSGAGEEALRAAAARDPADFDANRRLGKLLLGQGQPRQALTYLQRARSVNPADYQNSYDLALAYADTGQYDPARAMLQTLLAANDRAPLHHLLGDVEEKSGHPLEAAREYQRAARLDPSEANFFDWGAELLLHRATAPSVQVFSEGNRLFPNSVRLLLGLGVAWFAQGSYERSAGYLCHASDLDPTDSHPYLFLGKIQEVQPIPSPEIAVRLARFAELRPQDAHANYYFALSLWKQSEVKGQPGDLTQVALLLQKAARLDPAFGAAYLQLGILYAQQKRYPEAISSYQQAIAASPRLPDAHYRLAQAYMRTGDQAKARSELQLYAQLAREKELQAERERSHMQQFVYTLRTPLSSSLPR